MSTYKTGSGLCEPCVVLWLPGLGVSNSLTAKSVMGLSSAFSVIAGIANAGDLENLLTSDHRALNCRALAQSMRRQDSWLLLSSWAAIAKAEI